MIAWIITRTGTELRPKICCFLAGVCPHHSTHSSACVCVCEGHSILRHHTLLWLGLSKLDWKRDETLLELTFLARLLDTLCVTDSHPFISERFLHIEVVQISDIEMRLWECELCHRACYASFVRLCLSWINHILSCLHIENNPQEPHFLMMLAFGSCVSEET